MKYSRNIIATSRAFTSFIPFLRSKDSIDAS